MNLFRLIREYIAALHASTQATVAATQIAERALRDAAWTRYMENRGHGHHGGHLYHGHHPPHHGHGHGHHGGNASIAGGCAD